MTHVLRWVRCLMKRSSHNTRCEAEKIARLEAAERDLRDLQERAERAVRVLDDRQHRNHFADSIRASVRRA